MDKKIVISDIEIVSLTADDLNYDAEGVYHKKILTVFSVVQATEGSYDIKIDNSEWFFTGEGGVFIAPANVTQEIVHHNGKENNMKAQWVFMDVIVNGEYRLDDLFSFPVLLDRRYNGAIYKLIKTIRFPKNYFEKMRAVYDLLEILTEESEPKKKVNPVKTKIERFVKENYTEDVKAKDIAEYLYCSVAQVFRYTRKFYGFSPANYINSIRLQQAEIQLVNTDKTVGEIAFSVGFSDAAYFSRLFKKYYADTPSVYRKRYSEGK